MGAPLQIVFNNQRVGQWSWTRHGMHCFQYADSWLASPHCRPISLSLPIPAGGPDVRGASVGHYFDNLFGTRNAHHICDRDTHSEHGKWLQAKSLDGPGATYVTPAEPTSTDNPAIDHQPVEISEIPHILSHQDHSLLSDSNDTRPHKTGLLWYHGQWSLPVGETASTHILRTGSSILRTTSQCFPDELANGWLCLRLLAALGFETPASRLIWLNTSPALLLERTDRRWMGGERWLARLPMESFRQALGLPALHPSQNVPALQLSVCLQLLGSSTRATQDKSVLLRLSLAFWLLASPQCWLEDLALYILPQGKFNLAPVSHAYSTWPSHDANINLMKTDEACWRNIARASKIPEAETKLFKLLQDVGQALASIQQSLPGDFPRDLWIAVRDGVRSRQRQAVQALAYQG
jgi:serine/threonine-protein kinase HipA